MALSLPLLVFVLALAAVGAAPATADVGFSGPNYSGATAPTAEMSQSKLWVISGTWFASMHNTITTDFEIYRLDRSTHTWSSTGTKIDTRSGSEGDVLWDGSKLYSVSNARSGAGNVELRRFTYDSASKTFTQDSGFPMTIHNGILESVTIAKDTTGKLWATYTENHQVFVLHSTTSDTTWTAPVVIPVAGATNLGGADGDMSAVVSYGGKIGVMWSNETEDAMHFAYHVDGAADTAWTKNTAVQQADYADDHISLKALQGDSAGQVFAATKTSLSGSGPLILVMVLGNDNVWRRYTWADTAQNHTRATLQIDRQNRNIHVFASAPCCSGGTIYHKRANLDSPSFPTGLGTPFMQSTTDINMNNPTGTKQPLDATSDLVVASSDDHTDNYWHNEIELTPPETTINSGPTGTVSSSSATFTFSANEGGSTFQCKLDSGSFSSCTSPKSYNGLVDGSHSFSVQATDPAGNVDPTPATRTWTISGSDVRTFTFSPDGDATVDSTAPNGNFGTTTTLSADSSPLTGAYLLFNVQGIETVYSAKLRIFVTNGTTDGPAIYGTGTGWTETGITWNNRPGRTSGAVDDKGAVSASQYLEFDVTSLVTANGLRSFEVAATSADGLDANSKEAATNRPQLVITASDAVLPDTTINNGPTGTINSSSATFQFSSSEPDSTFECKLDTGAFEACTSPKDYTGLSEGSHTFTVKATDPAGNTDQTPDSRTWTIDTTAPAASITAGPSGATNQTGASFEFSSNETGSSFEC
jgi:hypothetical protein